MLQGKHVSPPLLAPNIGLVSQGAGVSGGVFDCLQL